MTGGGPLPLLLVARLALVQGNDVRDALGDGVQADQVELLLVVPSHSGGLVQVECKGTRRTLSVHEQAGPDCPA